MSIVSQAIAEAFKTGKPQIISGDDYHAAINQLRDGLKLIRGTSPEGKTI